MSGKTIPGSDAFKLYDTFGFPLDLTHLMAREKGLSIDEDGFKKEMDQQKKRAKSAEKFNTNVSEVSWNELKNIEDSKFKGYEAISLSAEIVKYASTDDSYLVVLDQTPFYAESGGQIGDTGTIKGSGVDLIVQDVQLDGECYVHHCTGTIGKDISTVECRVDFEKRQRTRKNHTATHLMHKALKMVLGDHVQQAGSLVHPDYLRFDLTHFEKISKKEIREIENIVNSEILINNKLDVSIKAFDEAKKEGAVAMFGEKYGDQVRVITVADFSKELCGGTHVDRTGDIGLFKITEETSLASGVRRIVAVTGPKAVEFVQDQVAALDEVKSQLKCNLNSIPDRLGQLIKDNKTLEKELKKQKSNSSFDTKILLKEALIIENKTIVIKMTDAEDMDSLKDFGNSLLLKLKNGIGVLGAVADKPMLVVVVTDTLIEAGIKAGDLAKQIGSIMGGGGGGRPNLATAGGKDQKSLETAMEKAKDIILKNIEEKNAV